MKASDIQTQLKNYKIRDGYLLKRSRILREWRKRWIVLTINFLFSFQNETCEKTTEIIDLKQIVSFRSLLKKSEDTEINCFYIQTKTTDFALATYQANQKWSWIVTIERLFDFKQRGSSQYNNIDQIKTQGFQSQNQFQSYQKGGKRKGSFKSSKPLGHEQQQKKKQLKADEILHKLIEQQQIINKREQQLIRQQKKLHKDRIIDSHYRSHVEKLTLKIKDLEHELLQQKNQKELKHKQIIENSLQKTLINNEGSNFQAKIQQKVEEMTESMKVNRGKSIEYLLDQFHSLPNRIYLACIAQFILKITEQQSFKYQQIISQQAHRHKYLSNFVTVFLHLLTMVSCSDVKNISRAVNLMNILFKDQQQLELKYYEWAERIVLDWSAYFTTETPFPLLLQTVSLLIQLLAETAKENREEATKTLTYLTQLSQNQQYKEKCILALNMLKHEQPIH